MVVHDFHVLGARVRPAEADPVLVIDPNRVLPGAVPAQFLEAEAGERQRVEGDGCVQLIQGPSGTSVKLAGQGLSSSLCVEPVEDVLGTPVPERDDQVSVGAFEGVNVLRKA